MATSAKKSTILLSGGLDSQVLVHQLRKEKTNLRAVYIDFGKSVTRNEVAVAKQVSNELDIPLEIVKVPGISDLQLGYLPLADADRDEADMKSEPTVSGQPYVSGFQIMLSLGSYFTQLTGRSSMNLAIIKEQFEHNKKLGNAFGDFQSLVSGINSHLSKFTVATPFAKLTKVEVIKLGKTLRVPMWKSWSCLHGGIVHCGVCSQCVSRKNAFAKAGITDKTEYKE